MRKTIFFKPTHLITLSWRILKNKNLAHSKKCNKISIFVKTARILFTHAQRRVLCDVLHSSECTAKFEENKSKKALQSFNIFHTPSNQRWRIWFVF